MSLFTLRCYIKERFGNVDSGNQLEIWEECIKEMLEISDVLELPRTYYGYYNDKFHFLWETMMLSLIGKKDITLRDFYNCGCNGNEKHSWNDIVLMITYYRPFQYQKK